MKYDVNVRSQDAIPTKLRGLISSVSKFACIYNNAFNTRGSGENEVIVLQKAKDRYHSQFGKSFPHEHVFRVVKESEKFNPVLMVDPKNICAPTNKRSKTSETPTASPGESDARTSYMNVESDPPSQTERTRPMGRNAARRAGSSSTTPTSSDSVSNIAQSLSSIATSNDTLIESLAARQRSIDFKIYMTSHAGLEGLELEVILEEKERLREKWGFRKYY